MFQQQTAGNQITWLEFFTVTALRFLDLTHWFLLGKSWVWFPIQNTVTICIIEANKMHEVSTLF
jgi:hypothetical protein